MRTFLATVVLVISLPICQSASEERKVIILPNPKMLGCKLADCSPLWLDKVAAANAVFPKQLIIDSNQRCVPGMTALYEKEVSFDDLKAAIDEHWGKFAVPGFEKSSIRLWRVAPDKFAIQLSVADKKNKKMSGVDPGTKQVIFLAFSGQPGCTAP